MVARGYKSNDLYLVLEIYLKSKGMKYNTDKIEERNGMGLCKELSY